MTPRTPDDPPPEDLVRQSGSSHPQVPATPIQWVRPGAAPICTGCQRPMHNSPEYPNYGTGCLVALLGLLFAPCLLGIPIIIIGLLMMNEKRNRWVCVGCGREVRL